MGRLDEYARDERAALLGGVATCAHGRKLGDDCPYCDAESGARKLAALNKQISLGRKVEALLKGEEVPHGLSEVCDDSGAAWRWFREEILEEHLEQVGLSGSLATGGVTGEERDGR